MKSHVIRFRLTQEERDQLIAKAGDASLSAWMREALLGQGAHAKGATTTQKRATMPKEPSQAMPQDQASFVAKTIHKTCVHCDKPASPQGWAGGVIAWLCVDHA